MKKTIQHLLIAGCAYLYSSVFSVIAQLLRTLEPHSTFARKWGALERSRVPYRELDCREGGSVWMHAASLGECKLLVRIHAILAAQNPAQLFVFTATTHTGVTYLKGHTDERCAAIGLLPFDTLRLMKGMVDRFSVTQVWVMETELWPSMLWVCYRQGIGVGVVNGRLEPRSFSVFKLLAPLMRPLFEHLNPVLAQSELYAQRFETLGVSKQRLRVVGNIKSRIELNRPDSGWWKRTREALHLQENDIVLTAGCVHPGEALALCNAAREAAEGGLTIKLILVPRHLEATGRLLAETGGTVLHLDRLQSAEPWQICLVEQYGVLEDLYALADAAFVGGTLVDIGGHNVWEAAQFGIPVFFGPHYSTQRESAGRLLAAGVGFCVTDAHDLAQQLAGVLRGNAAAFIVAQQQLRTELASRQINLEPLLIPAS